MSIDPITDAVLQDSSADRWLTWRPMLSTLRYSPPDQINRDNVADLPMVRPGGLGLSLEQRIPLGPHRYDVHAESARSAAPVPKFVLGGTDKTHLCHNSTPSSER